MKSSIEYKTYQIASRSHPLLTLQDVSY